MFSTIQRLLKNDAAGGILLGIAAIFALVMENSPLQFVYDALLSTPVAVQIGQLVIDKPLLLWINDGLMAVFFLLVGLEIKREIMEGALSSYRQISLPALAACGGLALPAIIYSTLNWGDAVSMRGWAIPAATDIAFALGVLLLLGDRVPKSLKVTLVAIAILDDLAAIVIIALFYTSELSMFSLLVAAIAVTILYTLNKKGVRQLAPYMITGIFLWVCVLKSGVHATLAGVLLAFFIPLRSKKGQTSPLKSLEHSLHPWVTYSVLPLFAFANAGVSLKGLSLELLMQPITLGIAAGLFFGKQIGVMAITALGVWTKFCSLPEGITWRHYYGMSLLTGIGFTMSLFIGTLAFEGIEHQTAVRLGVLSGSLLSGLCGYALLRYSKNG